MLIVVLVLLGLALGSFVNALVWRVHQQHEAGNQAAKKFSIAHGRSMCPKCGHELAAADLIPVFSWLLLRGRCRYCGQPISLQYPLVELGLVIVFVGSYIWWPNDLADGGQKLLFITWLAASVGLLALAVYDARWMLLPNRILYPTLAAVLAGRFGYLIFFSHNRRHDSIFLLLSWLVASGVFWLIFIASSGRWIGYGDVRLGLILGAILADPKLSFLMIFLASLLGLASVLAGLLGGRLSFGRKIAFGPFLIAAAWLSLLFGPALINWYTHLLI